MKRKRKEARIPVLFFLVLSIIVYVQQENEDQQHYSQNFLRFALNCF